MEKDDEVEGQGNSYTTLFRQLDARLGRWLTRDPKATAFESPYVSMGNNPIWHNDVLGDTITPPTKNNYNNLVDDVTDDIARDKQQLTMFEELYANQLKFHEEASEENKEATQIVLDKMSDAIGNLKNKISRKESFLGQLKKLETSSQWYAFNAHLTPSSDGKFNTWLQRGKNRNIIVVDYALGAGNQYHEPVHAIQFELGMIGFSKSTGRPMLYDKNDEIQAYQYQLLFDPQSVNNLTNLRVVEESDVDFNFINTIRDNYGNKVYNNLPDRNSSVKNTTFRVNNKNIRAKDYEDLYYKKD